LVANPLSSRCINIKQIQETCTDGCNSGTTDEERLIPACSSDKTTTDDSREGNSKNEGKIANTTARGRGIVDRLEVDGNVVDGQEERTGKDEGKSAHDPDGAVLEDAAGDHGSFTLDVTGNSPGDSDSNPTDKKTDDYRRVPSVSLTTVLNSQNVRDGKTHHQDDTEGIHLEELLKKRSLDRDGSTGSLEEQEDDGSRDTSNGEVDVETPSPGDVIGKSTTQERADDRSDTVCCADDTSKGRSLLRRSRETDDSISSSTETCTTNTSDGTASDKGFSIGSGTADDGAKFEDEDGHNEGCLEREVLVDFAPFGGVSDKLGLGTVEGIATYKLIGKHRQS
jgi:hypothetical protein